MRRSTRAAMRTYRKRVPSEIDELSENDMDLTVMPNSDSDIYGSSDNNEK
jgi:hypothetical protein